jgi:hypothetical protein
MAPRPGDLTNIGTTVPPAKVGSSRPVMRGGLPVARPVGAPEGEDPGPKVVAPDPLWISRWQPSATVPLSKAPWVVGYRWWVQGVVYQSVGEPMPHYRIDLLWRDHAHAYTHIPRALWEEFRQLGTSVGSWFHKKILGPNWRPGVKPLYPDFPIPR